MSMPNVFSILDFGSFGFAQDRSWIGQLLNAEKESDARRREGSRWSVQFVVREDARLK
jgi:hypothetical protein